MDILIVMAFIGAVLGLVGAGGAGVVIAVMTLGFDIPIHLALGTSLAAMSFTTFSGAFSHYREGNVSLPIGLAMGIFGAIGAFIGTKIATEIPGELMHYCTGFMLLVSALLIYLRVYHPENGPFRAREKETVINTKFYIQAGVAGIVCGILSGSFGIGATPFIQLVLLLVFGLPLFVTVGTTMVVIFPIALSGGIGYLLEGNLQFLLLVQVLVGLTAGSYVGAKFTRRVPAWFLKFMMVATPTIGGTLLFIR